jgi:hypothetical protein
VYGPDLGRGFVKDDFTWIRSAKQVVAKPARLIFPEEPGFYRPVVTATFVANYLRHGWDSRAYGWTNLYLYIACVVAIVLLALTLGVGGPAAAMTGFLWAINPHGINMALIWLSGRTSLCLTLFAVLAAVAFQRRYYLGAALLLFLALLSKEEAVALPFVLLGWTWLGRTDRPMSWPALLAALSPLVVYATLRGATPAFVPATAPSFYRFSFSLNAVARNALEYADRSTTIVAAALVIGAIVYRKVPVTDPRTRRLFAMLAIWFCGMFAITLWLPVRSSLYAVCPSVATAMAGSVVLDRMRQSARNVTVELLLAALLLLAIPLYRARNDPWVEGARVSTRLLGVIQADSFQLPTHGAIVLHDEINSVSNFHNAFGELLTEALQTMFERDWVGRIDGAAGPGGDVVIAEYRLRRGRIDRVRP